MVNDYKGKLQRWNDARGFGFILSENGKEEVFIHISALKNMRRRPLAGDTIFYQIELGNDGKRKAINASIEGVSVIQHKQYYRKKELTGTLLFWIIIVLAALYAYKNFNSVADKFNSVLLIHQKSTPTFKCDGRTYCSQMTSCEEATFFINNCPNTKMDGDNDGVPCESQWCG